MNPPPPPNQDLPARPKVPLAKLATDALALMDNDSLPEAIRFTAGLIRQLSLHMLHMTIQLRQISIERRSDLKQIDENFRHLTQLLQQLLSASDKQVHEVPAPQDEAAEESGGGAEPSAEQPPLPSAQLAPSTRTRPSGTGRAP